MTEEELYKISDKAEERCREMFERTDAVALFNTKKVLDAFKKHRVSDSCFAGTTGYGYDDLGRETIDAVWADVFGAEKALVRLDFGNGTHAITAAVFALVNPGETMLSATGEPYDTFNTVIGKDPGEYGTFRYYGIAHKVVGLKADGTPDIPEIIKAIREGRNIRTVLIQRSPGYSGRRAFSVSQIGEIIAAVRGEDPSIRIFVDNCYGEFTEKTEPTQVGADLIAGSLIKNPGGGLAPRGGYICGKEEFVEKAACRLTVPGIGGECGATLGNNRMLLQGLFMAPHTTAQALKSMIFASSLLDMLGFEVLPSFDEERHDIIQVIKLKTPENLVSFCKGIQSASPIDAYVSPEPSPMPGYDCDVVMAAGTFLQGATGELSADGPMREPYNVYLQGGLTYESGKLCLLEAARSMMN